MTFQIVRHYRTVLVLLPTHFPLRGSWSCSPAHHKVKSNTMDLSDFIPSEKLLLFILPSRPRETLHTYMLSHFNCVWLLRLWPTSLLCPWNSPGKNTGVDCHLLQGIFLTQGLNPRLLTSPALQAGLYRWATGEAIEALAWGEILIGLRIFRAISSIRLPFWKTKE